MKSFKWSFFIFRKELGWLIRAMMTRKNLIFASCGAVLIIIALNVVPLVDRDPVNVQKIPNGIFMDGACYQIVINTDEAMDEDLLQALIEDLLIDYIKE